MMPAESTARRRGKLSNGRQGQAKASGNGQPGNGAIHSDHTRTALAAYLRLLAVCLQDEAEMVEHDPERAASILDRFHRDVVGLAVEDAISDAISRAGLP